MPAVFNLRLPEALRGKLQESAESRALSLNAELLRRLELSFAMERREDGQRQLIDQLSKELSDERKRSNAQGDMLLQILARDMVLVHKDELPKRRGEAA